MSNTTPPSEIPEAPVATFEHQASSFERFLEENLKTLLIAGVVMFVGTIGYLIFNHFSESNASDEANAFTAAETVAEYREVVSSYPGTAAAGNAQIMIGKKLAEEDETKKDAIPELRTFVESYPEHPLRDQGLFQLATLLLENGEKKDAVAQMDKLISEFPSSHLTPYAKLTKGDFAYEDGNTDEARKIYTEVLTKHSGTEAAKLAEQRAEQSKIDPPEIVAPRPEPLPADATLPAPGIGAPIPFSAVPQAGDAAGGEETDATTVEVEVEDAGEETAPASDSE
jgi:predicted negative regulator of RcsB-dependent stress response